MLRKVNTFMGFQDDSQPRPSFGSDNRFRAHSLLRTANTHASNDEFEEAILGYYRALEIDPSLSEAHFGLGLVHLRLGNVGDGINELLVATRQDPGSDLYQYHLGYALTLANRDLESVVAFNVALEIDPDNAATHNSLGAVYLRLNYLDLATEHCFKATELDPQSVEARCNLGAVYERRGQFGDAAQQFQMALEVDPFNSEAHFGMGLLCMQLGLLDGSAFNFEAALGRSPNFAMAHYYLSRVYYQQGKKLDADRHLSIAKRLDRNL